MKAATALVLSLALLAAPAAAEGEQATAEEAVDKAREAALYLSQEGEAGLGAFADRHSPFIWKDSYVFVLDCAVGRTVAHPYQPREITLANLRDAKGRLFGPAFCAAAERPGGGWVEYFWPRPGADEPVRKVTFVMQVPAQPYQVGAGAYDDEHSPEQLEALLVGD